MRPNLWKLLAHNRCLGCEHEWHDRPGSFAGHAHCPACGGLYWKWLNYEEWTK